MDSSAIGSSELAGVIAEIERYRGHRSTCLAKTTVRLTQRESSALADGLAYPNGGALFVRHLLRTLDFDEHRIFAMRFEHKLVQAQVLQHYCPGVVPSTIGLTKELEGLSNVEAQQLLDARYRDGFIAKPCLGTNSRGICLGAPFDAAVLALGDCDVDRRSGAMSEEEFILQKKVEIVAEYRVHSIEDCVLPHLTYLRYAPSATNVASAGLPTRFVQDIIDNLPSGLLRDSLYGWDIAIDARGKPAVIEVNVTGMHPVFRAGFQCSGFFNTSSLGVHCLTCLLEAVTQMYGVEVEIEGPDDCTDHLAATYWLVQRHSLSYGGIRNMYAALNLPKGRAPIPDTISNRRTFTENVLLWEGAQIDRLVAQLSKPLSLFGPKGHEIHAGKGEEDGRVSSLIDQDQVGPRGLPRISADRQSLIRLDDLTGYDDQHIFFRKLLGDISEPTAPFDLSRQGGEEDLKIEEARIGLRSEIVIGAKEVSKRCCVALEALAYLVFAQMLARFTRRDDVVFYVVLGGTKHATAYADGRNFCNVLPMRISLANKCAKAALAEIQSQLRDLKANATASLSLAHRCSNLTAGMSLSTARIGYWELSSSEEDKIDTIVGTLADSHASLHADQGDEYIFDFAIYESPSHLVMNVKAPATAGASRLCQFAETALASLIEALKSDSATSVRALDILPAQERNILRLWSRGQDISSWQTPVTETFESVARISPDAVAVECEYGDLTYRELNDLADRLAAYLIALNIGLHQRVAICIEPSAEMIVSLLAVLKAGAAYVPLDPSYPRQRIQDMANDSKPAALLTQQTLSGLFQGWASSVPTINVDMEQLRAQPITPVVVKSTAKCAPGSIAYCIYTSGSTGAPKGVLVSHRSLSNLLEFMRGELEVGPQDAFLSLTTLSFDIAALELFLPLTIGARVRIVPKTMSMNVAALIEEIADGITVAQATPTRWQMLIDAGWKGKHDLKALCGGEALGCDLAEQIISRCQSAWNLYGPTETTIWSLSHKLPGLPAAVSIGKPIAGTYIYILDEWGELTPIGVIGELYIGGVGVAHGYLNKEALTKERFVPDPFAGDPEQRLFRTGDMVRYRPDGAVEFIGRNDTQIKLRGFRVELGEIESQLMDHPGVRVAVVTAHDDGFNSKSLIAYYMCGAPGAVEGGPLTSESLRNYLLDRLPPYMVPTIYVRLERMPLTPNGKVDRNQLIPPEMGEGSTPLSASPTERKLLDVWRNVLRITEIPLEESFLSVGGDSLQAMRLISSLRSQFLYDVSLEWLYSQDASIRNLGKLLDAPDRPDLPINPRDAFSLPKY